MRTINISSVHAIPWQRQFPHGTPVWDDHRFVFNADQGEYDYLVVFDDLHAPLKPTCPVKNTIHLATEPPSVQRYDDVFLSQFAWVITQDTRIEHPGAIQGQPGLNWFVGLKSGNKDTQEPLNFEELEALFEKPKSKLISVVASNKTFTPEHAARLDFAQRLKAHYGENIDFFGRGFAPMEDKLESLQDYRFQVVLENSVYDHYFSEKLTDCFIAGTFPLYYGCPNIGDYFPENSYRKIDIADFDHAVTVIDRAITDQIDKSFRNDLATACKLALYDYNLFPMLANMIKKIEAGDFGKAPATASFRGSMQPFRGKAFKAMKKRGKISRFFKSFWGFRRK